MRPARSEWLLLFTSANLLFVTFDVILAHSFNRFASAWEYLPLVVCPSTGVLCAAAFKVPAMASTARWALGVLFVMGAIGFYLHLESQFLTSPSLKSLVYTAPIAAPLIFCGLGLTGLAALDYERWSGWMPLLIAGGFFGNFALAVLDHAQNGFFYGLEWVATFVAAFGVFYFALIFWKGKIGEGERAAALAYAGISAVTGIVGFVAHVSGVLHTPADSLVERFVYGPPAFAPLLYADLAALVVIVHA